MVLLALAWRLLPGTLSPNTWFGHYAGSLRTVELNAPFYSWPTVATVKSWLRQCDGRPFVYTVKVNELITHTRRFEETERLVRDFGLIADLLGPHMGCLLFQLPPSFHYTAARLELDRRPARPAPAQRRRISSPQLVARRKCMTRFGRPASSSVPAAAPRLPDELIKTADEIYIRFHGTASGIGMTTPREELAVWAARVRDVPSGPCLGLLQQRSRSARDQECRRVFPPCKRPIRVVLCSGSSPGAARLCLAPTFVGRPQRWERAVGRCIDRPWHPAPSGKAT